MPDNGRYDYLVIVEADVPRPTYSKPAHTVTRVTATNPVAAAHQAGPPPRAIVHVIKSEHVITITP
jgi:hypothetical protein